MATTLCAANLVAYRIVQTYHESFNFANFVNFKRFAKLKLAHDFYSYCFSLLLVVTHAAFVIFCYVKVYFNHRFYKGTIRPYKIYILT